MSDELDRESARPRPRMSAARSHDDDDDDIREGDPPMRRRGGYDDDDDDRDDVRRRPRIDKPAPSVMAPAVCMLLVAILGVLLALFNTVVAVTQDPPPPDPNVPPFMQDIQKNAHGPLAAGVQAVIAVLSTLTVIGSIQMMRMKSWGLGVTASILSMINFGSCCCILGLPFGIWALVLLMKPEVKDAFS
jgi:hypothetical protein